MRGQTRPYLLLVVDLLVLHLHLRKLTHKGVGRGVGLQQVLRQVYRLDPRLGGAAHHSLCQLAQHGRVKGVGPSLDPQPLVY